MYEHGLGNRQRIEWRRRVFHANDEFSIPDSHFDVMYVDANHQYEYVLRDMMEARKKLKPGGIMQMNDFYEGPGGVEQNLGVVRKVASHAVVIDTGRVGYEGGASELLGDEPLVRRLLGVA